MAIRRSKLKRKALTIPKGRVREARAAGWSFTIQCPYEGELFFDFEAYRRHGRDDLAGHMRDAMWSLRHEVVGRSLISYENHGLRYFWRFLESLREAGELITRLDQIDRTLLDRYLAWLELQIVTRGPTKGQQLSLSAKRVSFFHLKALLSNRCKFASGATNSELSFPSNPYPFTNRRVPSRASYSASENKAIVDALRRDLRVIHGKQEETLPSLQVLIVHMLVLALAMGWNLQSLIELRRDSMSDHPLSDRKLFKTEKRRAGSERITSVREPKNELRHQEKSSVVPINVVEHFQFLCAYTSPLVSDAALRDRDLVFLWRVPKFQSKDQVVRLNSTRVSNALMAFRNRHQLQDDNGRPLRLSIARLRPTAATELYRRTHDIRKVQQYLGHASPLTTAKHYADKPFDAERDHVFVLESMVGHLTRTEVAGKVLVAADGQVPSADVNELLSGGYNTGIARCRNPFRKNDTVCQKYFTCFRCPNFCVLEDDLWRLFSFYERLLAERIKINPMHWMKTYGPIVRRIDADITPLFPKDKVDAARRKAQEEPHPAWKQL